MKEIVETLSKNALILKSLNQIDNKKLGIRKRVKLFWGVDIKSNYTFILTTKQESKFITKNMIDMLEILSLIQHNRSHNFKNKILLISNQICSKVKKSLKEDGWKVYKF